MNIFKDTMLEMTYEQVEKLAEQEAIVLFPVGIIEEHGPHLPLGSKIWKKLLQHKFRSISILISL